VLEGDIIQMDGSTQKEERDAIIKVIIFCKEFLSSLTFLLFTLYIGVMQNFNSWDGPSILLLSARVAVSALI